MATLPQTRFSEEEYLELDRKAEHRSEFYDGQIFAMAGGSLNHSVLATGIGAILRAQVPRGCLVCNTDLRINIAAARMYTYPDCSVICGEPKFSGDRQDCLINPMLIVEVLSPSTEGYDRGRKFEFYRTIPSFCEYLIVHQDRARVEHFSRQSDGSWLLREHSGLEATFSVSNLAVHIPLADLYAKVPITESPAPPLTLEA